MKPVVTGMLKVQKVQWGMLEDHFLFNPTDFMAIPMMMSLTALCPLNILQ